MKKIFIYISIICLAAFVFFTASCDSENSSSLQLNSSAAITSFSLGNYQGTVNQINGTIVVNVPSGTDITSISPTYTLANGASADLVQKEPINFTLPVCVTVSNGDVYRKYMVSVSVDEAKILTFKIGNYVGSINNNDNTVTVYVPQNTDVTSLDPVFTITTGAQSDILSGTLTDFTNFVSITVTHNTAKTVYSVKVIPTALKLVAFIGTAKSIDEITSPEEKTAAKWLLNNVSGAEYISFDDVNSGTVQLSKYHVVWWHWQIDGYSDAVGYPSSVTTAVTAFKSYYEQGGNLLLTRYASRFLESLGISLDKRAPNNCWGGSEDSPEIASSPWGISFKGHTDHPLFKGLQTASGKDYVAYLFNTGYGVTNSTSQWHIGVDWGGYATAASWTSLTGGIALGRSDGDADNENGSIVIAEFPARVSTGTVLVIGSGAYDWYATTDNSDQSYRSNLYLLTKNAIDYLNEK